MMRNWYEGGGPGDWTRRCFSFLNLGILALTLLLLVAEFRFDWCESLAGRFLMSTNEGRPEIGSIWETGRQTLNARQSLNEIILRKADAEKNVRSATSFTDLAKGLGTREWVNLDKDQFKQLYLSLAPETRQALIEPARLVWLLNGSTTARIFCEGRPGGIKIYFIDSGNRVIRQIDLDTRTLEDIPMSQDIIGSLDDLPGFSGTIYQADRFFEAVFKLPGNMIPDLIQEAEVLLNQAGSLDRVGIWNASEFGYIRLGFEFSRLGQTRVVQVRAREWAVWQLNLILKGEDL